MKKFIGWAILSIIFGFIIYIAFLEIFVYASNTLITVLIVAILLVLVVMAVNLTLDNKQ